MKKNKAMRLASVLLILTLLTTSVISGTFAKYVTSDSASDTARVAKWGVVASASGDLFGATYSAVADGNSIITYSKNEGTVSSNVGAEDFVVAPGTKNTEGLKLSVTGTPEVATAVTLDAAEDENGKNYYDSDIYLATGEYGIMVPYEGVVTHDNVGEFYYKDGTQYKVAGVNQAQNQLYELRDDVKVEEKYYPIVWTVQIGKNAAFTEDTLEDVKTALTPAFNGKSFAPNTDNALSATLTWEWKYGQAWQDVADDQEKTTVIDKQDTVLGNMMASQKDGTDFVDVVKKNGTVFNVVTYKEEAAGTNAANTVINAYANGAKVACLTVAFNARLTVTQVD